MKLDVLRLRAELLDRLRRFFRERGFLEVETPLAAPEAIPERHIDLVKLEADDRWLQASPEMHHKRLLCAGSGPIFEVTRSFRGRETGPHHSPEFTIVEWYRPGHDMHAGMRLLDELLQELLGTPPAKRTSYRDAFARAAGFEPHGASLGELRAAAEAALRQPLAGDIDRDELLNVVLSSAVEPTLGRDTPELLYHYPATQAALATTATDEHGASVAERFELYHRGLELANGYHELTDAVELRRRLTFANERRVAASGRPIPMPERLLGEMDRHGLPACAGVALGFDRVVMLAAGVDRIREARWR